MKTRFAALLLALAAGSATAQSLSYGVSVSNLQATRDTTMGQTTITGTVTNNGDRLLPAPSIVFALYDANGAEIGRVAQRAEAPLPPGASWELLATTPQSFSRFTAVDVKAE
ncbi:FxLYD domain-containing protein [Bordetella genomosp. 13]|uniref:FxLYD domain-containing protein n=1 Tax=Bordetella genomosp. 13 TaxID=463040 RepID=UPI0011A716B8|nr:FxLYD domain-containing protein [Bordetella genomosp. 13]